MPKPSFKTVNLRAAVRACRMLPVVLFLILCALSSDARADGLVITGGYLTVTSSILNPSFSFSAQGVALSNSNSPGDTGLVSARCAACPAGSTVSLFSTHSGILGTGPATINGVVYNQLYYGGTLQFQGSVVIPQTTANAITIRAPFTFTGLLEGCVNNPFINGCDTTPVLSTTVSGQGWAVLELVASQGTGLYDFRSIRYDFAPQAVPEPATLLLLGTGLAGVAARYRRRRAG